MLQNWDNHTSGQIKFTTGFIPGKLNHFNPWQYPQILPRDSGPNIGNSSPLFG
jgi:hypothetical protein